MVHSSDSANRLRIVWTANNKEFHFQIEVFHFKCDSLSKWCVNADTIYSRHSNSWAHLIKPHVSNLIRRERAHFPKTGFLCESNASNSSLYFNAAIRYYSQRKSPNCFEIVRYKPVLYCFLVKRLNINYSAQFLGLQFHRNGFKHQNDFKSQAYKTTNNANWKEHQRIDFKFSFAIVQFSWDFVAATLKVNFYHRWSRWGKRNDDLELIFFLFSSINLWFVLHWPCSFSAEYVGTIFTRE